MMTKQEAKIYSERTALRLNKKVGGKWQTRVWNNLDWCCDVYLGSVTVSIDTNLPHSRTLRFHAYVGSQKNKASGALAMWHDGCVYRAPEEAVKNAMMKAREVVLELEDNVSNNFDLMPKLREDMKKELSKKRNYTLHG